MRLKILTFALFNAFSFLSFRWYCDSRIGRVYEQIVPSIVKVRPVGLRHFRRKHKGLRHFGVLGHGTGVIVGHNLILTCAHMTENAGIFVISSDKGSFYASLLGIDETHDLALLRPVYPIYGYRAASLGKTPQIGDSVLVVGYPQKFVNHLTTGVISSRNTVDDFSTAVISPGSSGSGMFNMRGELIGLVTAFFVDDLPVWQGITCSSQRDAIKVLIGRYE